MTPVPTNLAQAARLRDAERIYWVTRNGLKLTGMPAWRFHYDDEQLWDITAFVESLDRLSPAEYEQLVARDEAQKRGEGTGEPRIDDSDTSSPALFGADPAVGALALDNYGCTSCHEVSGVPGKQTYVGPPLDGVAERAYLAGVLRNDPANMIRWIRDPQRYDPLTAMPDLGVTAEHARDITAFLYQQKED